MKMNNRLMSVFWKAPLFFLLLISVPLNSVNISESPYGINAHQESNAVLAKVVAAGIKWIRVDIFWNEVEAVKGTFTYTNPDRVINYANSNGLSILAVLSYTPRWANSTKSIHQPPDDVSYWRTFVQKTVQRYKSKVKYWSIWNEPNMPDFFESGKDVFVSKIFVPAAQAIKAADSGAFIVGPDLAHKTTTGTEWYFWLKYILDNAGQYIDVISHHVYHDQSIVFLFELLEKGEALIPGVRDIIEEAGYGHLPFWVTETGWQTYLMAEEVQADRYLEFLQRMQLKSYPHKVFFYEIIDNPDTSVEPYGILSASMREKPAYRVYADFIAGLYPPLEGEDEPESKKCYAEETVASRGERVVQRETLNRLRVLRDRLLSSPRGASLVQNYYRHASEFARLARTDSRLFRLGQDLLLDLGDAGLGEGDSEILQVRISAEADELLGLLLQKELSPSFRAVLEWCGTQLRLISREGIDSWKEVQLPRRMRGD